MLTDKEEIRIISKAKQKNVRDPKRSRAHFIHIFSDFLNDVRFKDATFLDFGPGQYDFGEMVRERGAVTHGIDKDPAVNELGRYKGFLIRFGELKDIKAEDFDAIKFDGIFCKLSINAFWFYDEDQRHIEYIREVVKLIKPGGWAWIAPWNGVPKQAELSEADVKRVLSIQAQEFKETGFTGIDLTTSLSKYYGVHGLTANHALFLLNLKTPTRLKGCKEL